MQKRANEAAKLLRFPAEQAASLRWSLIASTVSFSGPPCDAWYSDQTGANSFLSCSDYRKGVVPRVGFEPTAYRLRSGCSTAELSGRRDRQAIAVGVAGRGF